MAHEEFVEDDPEYEAEPEDDDAALAGIVPTDPSNVPPDEGDAGQAGAAGDGR